MSAERKQQTVRPTEEQQTVRRGRGGGVDLVGRRRLVELAPTVRMASPHVGGETSRAEMMLGRARQGACTRGRRKTSPERSRHARHGAANSEAEDEETTETRGTGVSTE